MYRSTRAEAQCSLEVPDPLCNATSPRRDVVAPAATLHALVNNRKWLTHPTSPIQVCSVERPATLTAGCADLITQVVTARLHCVDVRRLSTPTTQNCRPCPFFLIRPAPRSHCSKLRDPLHIRLPLLLLPQSHRSAQRILRPTRLPECARPQQNLVGAPTRTQLQTAADHVEAKSARQPAQLVLFCARGGSRAIIDPARPLLGKPCACRLLSD